MKELRYYFSILYGSIKISILDQLEYPAYFICWIIGIPIQYFAGVGIIVSISKQFGGIGGFNYGDLIFLYGLGLISQALMVIFFIQTWHIDSMVIRGELDRMLLRPVSVIYQFCTNYFNFIGFIDLLPGVVIFLYGCRTVNFNWTIVNLLKILCVILGAVMIRAALFTLFGSISFWAKGSRALVDTGYVMLEKTAMYPISIYPYVFQVFLTYILPLGFISFYPSVDLLHNGKGVSINAGFSFYTLLAGIIMGAVALTVFKIGIGRYESSGS